MTTPNFFDLVRPHFPGSKLNQEQVDGINAIIAGFALYGDGDPTKLAYCLATAKWETAHTMQPIIEIGGKAYFNKYEPGTKIGKVLGNTVKGDGARFKGRGLAMLTGRRNYADWAGRLGLPLLDKPELAQDMDTAVRILIEGSMLGSFTGKALSAFIDGIDESDDEDLKEYLQARRVINGVDRAKEIGESALVFEHALDATILLPAPRNDAPLQPVEPDAPTDAAPRKPFNWLKVGGIAVVLLVLVYIFLT